MKLAASRAGIETPGGIADQIIAIGFLIIELTPH
jgi:hypothetical protein